MRTRSASKVDTPKKLHVDAESRALMANPVFRAMLAEAKNGRHEDDIPLEEIERRLGPMTDAEKAHADAYLDSLDWLEAEQGGEVSDDQGRLLRLMLIGAEFARGEGTLAQLAEDSGCAKADIRAVAAALAVLGLTNSRVKPEKESAPAQVGSMPPAAR